VTRPRRGNQGSGGRTGDVVGGLAAEGTDVPHELANHRNFLHEGDLPTRVSLMPRSARSLQMSEQARQNTSSRDPSDP
jgi:hypothetical protein